MKRIGTKLSQKINLFYLKIYIVFHKRAYQTGKQFTNS